MSFLNTEKKYTENSGKHSMLSYRWEEYSWCFVLDLFTSNIKI